MSMKIALYARVSTNRQTQSQSIEQQIERLQEAVTQHADWELAPEHIYRHGFHKDTVGKLTSSEPEKVEAASREEL
jgi:DNA invertase Pin-like site-specific DNA recombinase